MLSTSTITTKCYDHDLPACSTPYKTLSHLSSGVSALTESMNFITNAFSPRPSSAGSQQSLSGSQVESSNDVVGAHQSPIDLLSKPEQDERLEGSVSSASKPKRHNHRTKTSFQLRYPPPTTKQKQRLHIRPKILLQLHRTSQDTRPIPTYDILPSAVFASRLARRFPHTFRGKTALGVDDLVVATSELYRPDAVDGKGDSREILAAICQLPSTHPSDGTQRKAEICLGQLGTWTGQTHLKTGYEFVSVDEHGTERVARWVPRRRKRSRDGDFDTSNGMTGATSEKKAFSFSLINPSSRRHAVIASMDAQSIDVFDSYSTPTATNNTDTLTSPTESVPSLQSEGAVEVDDDLRFLIVMTGIWVAFCEGFTGNSRPLQSISEPRPSSEVVSDSKRRSLSLNLARDRGSFAGPSSESDTRSRARPSLQQSGSTPIMPTSPPPNQNPLLPRRTQSVSTAFLQRANSRRNQMGPRGRYEIKSLIEDGFTTDESSSTLAGGSLPSESQLTAPIRSTENDLEKRRKSRGFRRLFGSSKKADKSDPR